MIGRVQVEVDLSSGKDLHHLVKVEPTSSLSNQRRQRGVGPARPPEPQGKINQLRKDPAPVEVRRPGKTDGATEPSAGIGRQLSRSLSE